MVEAPFDLDYPRVLLVARAAVTLVAFLVAASTSTVAYAPVSVSVAEAEAAVESAERLVG